MWFLETFIVSSFDIIHCLAARLGRVGLWSKLPGFESQLSICWLCHCSKWFHILSLILLICRPGKLIDFTARRIAVVKLVHTCQILMIVPANICINKFLGTSLVAQWLRILLSMKGTWVQALVREDPTCHGATKPVCHNYWACALEPASHNHWSPLAYSPCSATREATAMRSLWTATKE